MAENEWPPPEFARVRAKQHEWLAWYAGDRESLENAGSNHGTTKVRGVYGYLRSRWNRFWHLDLDTADNTGEIATKIHVPLAADIARATRDLMFAEPPTIEAVEPDLEDPDPQGDQPPEIQSLQKQADLINEQIARYLDDGLMSILAAGAEVGSAIGGVFFRVVWDSLQQRVFLTRVNADVAYPTFNFDRLESVRFERRVTGINQNSVYRHIETHFTGLDGTGLIQHDLWEGTDEKLGRTVDWSHSPAMNGIAQALKAQADADLPITGNTITTQTPGLAVSYIPNVLPNPAWMGDPVGCHLGAADIAGSEDLLDQLDMAYSHLMQEVELSRARMIVPEQWLTDLGSGRGMGFDTSRNLFASVNAPPTAQGVAQFVQPNIRVDQYIAVIQELTENIVRRAGFSTSTFGEDEQGASTATEVNSKDARSVKSRASKVRAWQPEILYLVRKMLAIDVKLGWADASIDPELVQISFPQPAQSPTEVATRITTLRGAGVMSRYTALREAHPDWKEPAILAEIKRLDEESATAAAAMTAGMGVGAPVDPFQDQGDDVTGEQPGRVDLTNEEVVEVVEKVGVE